ncbi:nucleotidyl transferase AbiEii/AbiGii toxin family protein [Thermosulfurimonas sp. F29]|uniref:nucleotidyl transferase AbiEii/AbiGii toxin family protein n=1 Tax=Thermosulfurimonas sp. F29 TaxID=2867247 RepID=UPI001C83B67E|nr:nucleotidyl transferase AbiEii/AbiGii toxin family protein [Thermosulfurimonas sp. F29]MBX6424154.1 nucleotidyl transferase AbiEii/AbiGii toxin family protein [Thermosulfurimonas sp. F29]
MGKAMRLTIPPFGRWEALRIVLKKLSHSKELAILWENTYLIGGTALSLQVRHRLSYDLDLAWIGTDRLPWRGLVSVLEKVFKDFGIEAQRFYREDIDRDLLMAGIYPEEQYLFWMLRPREIPETVKFEVWIPDSQQFKQVLLEQRKEARYGLVRLASAETIFRLKTLLLPRRRTWRDLFDLWWLVRSEKYPKLTYQEIIRTLRSYYSDATVDSVLLRLRNLRLEHLGDQGFCLVDGTAPDWARLFETVKQDLLTGLTQVWLEEAKRIKPLPMSPSGTTPEI